MFRTVVLDLFIHVLNKELCWSKTYEKVFEGNLILVKDWLYWELLESLCPPLKRGWFCPLPPLSTHPMWRGCGSCRQAGLQEEVWQSSSGFPREGQFAQGSCKPLEVVPRSFKNNHECSTVLALVYAAHSRDYFSNTFNFCNEVTSVG